VTHTFLCPFSLVQVLQYSFDYLETVAADTERHDTLFLYVRARKMESESFDWPCEPCARDWRAPLSRLHFIVSSFYKDSDDCRAREAIEWSLQYRIDAGDSRMEREGFDLVCFNQFERGQLLCEYP
jgi:hypothetical protein